MTHAISPVQARAEDYTETLAFVRLLNTLLRTSSSVLLPEEGRAAAIFAQHVRDDVLGQIMQRSYRHASVAFTVVAFDCRQYRGR